MNKLDLSALKNAKYYSIDYINCNELVNNEFLKSFRKNNNLTQVRLANILNVTKKTIEKWEQGVNPIKGTSAALLYLLNKKPELIKEFYVEERNYVIDEVSEFEEVESVPLTFTMNNKVTYDINERKDVQYNVQFASI